MIKAKALVTLSLLVWALLLICGPRALVREGGEWRVVHFHNTTIDEGKIAAAGTPAKN